MTTSLVGTGVSPGVAVGQALVVERAVVPVFRRPLHPDEVEGEVRRLAEAIETSRQQLQAIKDRLSQEVGVPHAYLLDAELLMLDDPLLLDRSVAIIHEDRVNAEWALRAVSDQLHASFDEFSDVYLKERSTDVADLLGRVQQNLLGGQDAPSLSHLPGKFVLVTADLSPSEAAELDWDKVLAVVTDAGSRTHHAAILARSLGVPGVVGLGDATRRIPRGALVVVDGTRGEVVVEPSAQSLEQYRMLHEQDRNEDLRLRETRGLPSLTRDGVWVRLQANAEFPDEAATALLYGAEGIGLFRSEYLLGRSRQWPGEEEQLDVYRRLLEQMRPHPVTVRTWDVGPEELCPGGPSSRNPALGERALRLLHRDKAPFRTQLRALLRAALHGPLRIMFPFLGGPSDLRTAFGLLEEARSELRREGIAHQAEVPVGINLEVPSAALMADVLARDVDFFSVGTNDLIQYLLAVDRVDPRVSKHYEPLHPAVLRVIRAIVEAAGAQGIPVAVCGEMAGDPLHALVILGLGVRELSMSPAAIPRVKAVLRGASAARARDVALACLSLATAGEIETAFRSELADALDTAEAFLGQGREGRQ